MKKFSLLAIACALMMAVGSNARGQVILDMSKITCEQLLTASPDAVDAAVWLSGYYNGLKKNTRLDLNQFKKNADAVVEACKNNPKKSVMALVDEMRSKRK